MAYALARASKALLVGAGSSDVAQVIHTSHYSDGFDFWQVNFS